MSPSPSPEQARQILDEHFREIVRWHFSAETGTPYWLDWAKSAGFEPAEAVQSFADITRFEHFDGELLRSEPHERWVPKAYAGRPFMIFETGGTTGMPKQRINWEDYKRDYENFEPFVREGGFICFHDIRHPWKSGAGARQVWDAVKGKHRIYLELTARPGFGVLQK